MSSDPFECCLLNVVGSIFKLAEPNKKSKNRVRYDILKRKIHFHDCILMTDIDDTSLKAGSRVHRVTVCFNDKKGWHINVRDHLDCELVSRYFHLTWGESL